MTQHDDTARLGEDAGRCDVCCCPKARHIGSDLQCPETTYFRSMAEHQRLLDRIEALEAGLRDNCRAMEYWAGCPTLQPMSRDEAILKIMSSGGSWPAEAYDAARALLEGERADG